MINKDSKNESKMKTNDATTTTVNLNKVISANGTAKLAVTESFSDTYESDYSSTPSKNNNNKKVVYEVIV